MGVPVIEVLLISLFIFGFTWRILNLKTKIPKDKQMGMAAAACLMPFAIAIVYSDITQGEYHFFMYASPVLGELYLYFFIPPYYRFLQKKS